MHSLSCAMATRRSASSLSSWSRRAIAVDAFAASLRRRAISSCAPSSATSDAALALSTAMAAVARSSTRPASKPCKAFLRAA